MIDWWLNNLQYLLPKLQPENQCPRTSTPNCWVEPISESENKKRFSKTEIQSWMRQRNLIFFENLSDLFGSLIGAWIQWEIKFEQSLSTRRENFSSAEMSLVECKPDFLSTNRLKLGNLRVRFDFWTKSKIWSSESRKSGRKTKFSFSTDFVSSQNVWKKQNWTFVDRIVAQVDFSQSLKNKIKIFVNRNIFLANRIFRTLFSAIPEIKIFIASTFGQFSTNSKVSTGWKTGKFYPFVFRRIFAAKTLVFSASAIFDKVSGSTIPSETNSRFVEFNFSCSSSSIGENCKSSESSWSLFDELSFSLCFVSSQDGKSNRRQPNSKSQIRKKHLKNQ